MKKLLICFCLATIFFCAPQASAEQSKKVQEIESYLNSLKTLKANFTQTAADGSQTSGTFYLSRPGKLRFEYDAPSKDFIVADGTFIYFYDGQMGEQANTRISNSLADFFLRKDLSLSGDIRVVGTAQSGDLFYITLTQTADPGAGSLTLGLTKKPDWQLNRWSVRDAHGQVTDIELSDIKKGISLRNNLFFYHDPKRQAPIYNN